MGRFVQPQITRLPISAGDYIDVKHRLNTGEEQDLMARLAPLVTPGERIQLNSREVRTAKVLAYLLGWSFMENGQPVSVSEGAINNLDPDTFKEIETAIDAHENAVQAEVDRVKQNPTGSAELSST